MDQKTKLLKLIRQRRKELGVSQTELSKKVGVKASYLSEIESGVKKPSLRLVFSLAHELQIDISQFIPHIATNELRSAVGTSLPWRQASLTLDLIKTVSHTLRIKGINCLHPCHEGREDILRILNSGGRVDICFLDIRSEAFVKRQEKECKNIQTGKTSRRLEGEFIATMSILEDIQNLRTNGNLNVRLYSEEPVAAIVISDDGFLEYNPYQKSKAQSDTAATQISRGLMNPVKFLTRDEEPALFAEIVAIYDAVWSKAKPVEPANFFDKRNWAAIINK